MPGAGREPARRQDGVVQTERDLDVLARRARALVRSGRRAVLGVTGAPGAGKTTLVLELLDLLAPTPPDGLTAGAWVAHVPMDGFHLADVQLDRLGRRARKGAPDTFDAAGYVALLQRVVADTPGTVYAPGFERDLDQPVAAAIAVEPAARLVVTEGNYLLLDDPGWAPVRAVVDEVWYVDVPDALRLSRLTARHEAFGKTPQEAAAWARGSDQVNAEAVAASRGRADLVVVR